MFSGTQRWFRVVQVLEWLHKLQMHPQIAGIIGIMHTVRLCRKTRLLSPVKSPSSVRFHAWT